MISRLKDKLDATLKGSEPLAAVWSSYRDPFVVRELAKQGFDAVVLDGQHGFHDETSVLEAIPHIVNEGKSPLVRIPVNRWDMVQKVLDFGALGVIAPMIDTAEEARAFAEAAKFPKLGLRSHGPRHGASLYGITPSDYLLEANANTLAFVQIETRAAYENLDEILEVEGIDGVLMGPADFSIFMTGEALPDVYGEATVDAVADIAKRTLAKGKYAAAFTQGAEFSKLVKSMGYQLISVSIDSAIVTGGSSAILDGLKG